MHDEPLNDIKNDESSLNNEESDYQNLITRLKDISKTIALVEKQYFNNL